VKEAADFGVPVRGALVSLQLLGSPSLSPNHPVILSGRTSNPAPARIDASGLFYKDTIFNTAKFQQWRGGRSCLTSLVPSAGARRIGSVMLEQDRSRDLWRQGRKMMATVPRSLSGPADELELQTGDRMTRQEFHRIYEKMPEDLQAELIGGVV
jgi:hypothetical protein